MNKRVVALLVAGALCLSSIGLAVRGVLLWFVPPPGAPRSLALVVVFGGLCGVLGGGLLGILALADRSWRQ